MVICWTLPPETKLNELMNHSAPQTSVMRKSAGTNASKARFTLGGTLLGRRMVKREPKQAYHLGRQNANQDADEQAVAPQVGENIAQLQIGQVTNRHAGYQEQHHRQDSGLYRLGPPVLCQAVCHSECQEEGH